MPTYIVFRAPPSTPPDAPVPQLVSAALVVADDGQAAVDVAPGSGLLPPTGDVTYACDLEPSEAYDVEITVDTTPRPDEPPLDLHPAHPIELPDAPPTAAFTFTPASPNASDEITFDASASDPGTGAITAYGWDFGDGVTGAGAVATHTYNHKGAYDVFLTITTDQAATDQTAQTVTAT
jgi:PKD repeat protein